MTNDWSWAGLVSPGSRVLLVVNSAPEQRAEIDAVLDALTRTVGLESVSVIAPNSIRATLIRRGLSARAVLPARLGGVDVEFDYFLESDRAVRWAICGKHELVVGSEPYALHNEEVKTIFEQRVAGLLGGARYVIHSLPNDQAFSLTAEQLWDRAARSAAFAAYRAAVCRTLDGLYQRWLSSPEWGDADQAAIAEQVSSELEIVPTAAPSPQIDEARRFAFDRLQDALRAACRDQQTRVRTIVDPPGTRFQTVAFDARVDEISRPAHVARETHWRRTRLSVRGRVAGPFSYLLASRLASLARADFAVAIGRVYRGGVTVGLQRDEQWTSKVDIDEPGEFVAVVMARAAGPHRLVIANCVRDGGRDNAFILRRFGWGRDRRRMRWG